MLMMKPIAKRQSGVMLLEALIGILIFSIGILAVVGLQAFAIGASTDGMYRTQASILANNLIAQMWVGDRTPTTLQANFQGGCTGCTPGPAYTAWEGLVGNALPNVTNGLAPSVEVTPQTVAGYTLSSLVVITIQWRTPDQRATALPHQYVVQVQIV
jgi:type IV pilus assembly protein PilV